MNISILLLAAAIQIELAAPLFEKGEFDQARLIYARESTRDPKDFEAALGVGKIAVLRNDLNEAERWLTKAIELKPEDRTAKAYLAEAFYRRDQFQKAAPLMRQIGQDAAATKLESFQDKIPYRIEGNADVSHVKFVQTDPLPVVAGKVNGAAEVNFLIDTGGGELIIDPEFAKEIGVSSVGFTTGTYAGGAQASSGHGRIDSLTLGDFVIRNLPVQILESRRFSAVAKGKRIDGIIGTVLLYHFLSTLDYPGGELVLRRKTTQTVPADGLISVPFWLAGDHVMVAWGSANGARSLFFIDTGLAGGGFTAPESMVKAANIKLMETQARTGLGGGGTVRVVPLVVEELTLGDARQNNIAGAFGAFPPPLENRFGFRIGGLISHTFFRPYAVTFDFTEMKIILKSASK